MDAFIQFASSLLSWAHGIFGPELCPGDWVWSTSTAGAMIALFPVIGAMIVALIRKGTGNTYNGTTISVFAGIGLVSVLAIPWFLSTGVSEVFRAVFAGGASAGSLPMSEAYTLDSDFCGGFLGSQKEYLGGGPNVFEILMYPDGRVLAYGFYLGALIGLPLLCLLFIMLQARTAFRRGPKWPSRLFWLPFVALVLCTAPVEGNTAVHLWLGFLPVSVLGIVPIAMLGAPSWSVINRAKREKKEPAPPPYEPPPPPYEPPEEEPPPLAQTPGPMPVPTPIAAGAFGSGRFRKVRQLGHGGFGTVWMAVDTQLDRTVAVKTAHAPDADTEQRMLREARALAAVHHPNLVRVYDVVAEPEGMSIVMEYIEGSALSDAVYDNGLLDDVLAARLWGTVAGALSAAHQKGVLHRDVKPSNVIVDPRGMPHLIDFGIARAKGDSTLTATGMMVGTPDFLAPETAAGAPATPASDAWQLAATVSFALAGHPPRGERETPMAALMAAAQGEPYSKVPLRSAHQRLLAAALDQDPARRPTLDSIAQQMDAWLGRSGRPKEGPVTTVVPTAQAPQGQAPQGQPPHGAGAQGQPPHGQQPQGPPPGQQGYPAQQAPYQQPAQGPAGPQGPPSWPPGPPPRQHPPTRVDPNAGRD